MKLGAALIFTAVFAFGCASGPAAPPARPPARPPAPESWGPTHQIDYEPDAAVIQTIAPDAARKGILELLRREVHSHPEGHPSVESTRIFYANREIPLASIDDAAVRWQERPGGRKRFMVACVGGDYLIWSSLDDATQFLDAVEVLKAASQGSKP